MPQIENRYNDKTNDLLYAILLRLGGSTEDIENVYVSTTNDLLYAILKVIKAAPIAPPDNIVVDDNNVNVVDELNTPVISD